MFADFQEVGKEHCCIDILKSFVRDGVIALGFFFKHLSRYIVCMD